MLEQYLAQYNNDADKLDAAKALASEHPYFLPAQFYLLKNTDSLSEAYNALLGKNAILFNNDLWLNFLLNKTDENALQAPITMQEPAADLLEKAEDNTAEIPLPDTEKAISKDMMTAVHPSHALDELPAFQPLYTTDYFASQGIKVGEASMGTDKLSKQLRSFTEWLKTMKKVHPEKLAAGEETNTTVQIQAEKSNKEDVVLTEAMAEVLVQQGKIDKAIEIYHKLSLTNTAKSAFFASKIEQLKGN
jgi:hypothetical protein